MVWDVSFLCGKSTWGLFDEITCNFLDHGSVESDSRFGALSSVRAILREVWIHIRILFEYVTDAEGGFDVWYWAPCLSPIWHSRNAIKYVWEKPMEYPRVSVASDPTSGQTGGLSYQSAGGSASR